MYSTVYTFEKCFAPCSTEFELDDDDVILVAVRAKLAQKYSLNPQSRRNNQVLFRKQLMGFFQQARILPRSDIICLEVHCGS